MNGYVRKPALKIISNIKIIEKDIKGGKFSTWQFFIFLGGGRLDSLILMDPRLTLQNY